MLCASDVENLSKYHCHAFDIEVSGNAVTRYLGHDGTVHGFSTCATTAPNRFLTWRNDGYARLYDTRWSMPVLTIAGEDAAESGIPAAALAYPDGLPCECLSLFLLPEDDIDELCSLPVIFVGESKAEKRTPWDVRAQKPLYELATGNNLVESMV